MIHFGTNGLLILGISIEEETKWGSNLNPAYALLSILKKEFNTQSGGVAFEVPPVDMEEELGKQISLE